MYWYDLIRQGGVRSLCLPLLRQTPDHKARVVRSQDSSYNQVLHPWDHKQDSGQQCWSVSSQSDGKFQAPAWCGAVQDRYWNLYRAPLKVYCLQPQTDCCQKKARNWIWRLFNLGLIRPRTWKTFLSLAMHGSWTPTHAFVSGTFWNFGQQGLSHGTPVSSTPSPLHSTNENECNFKSVSITSCGLTVL